MTKKSVTPSLSFQQIPPEWGILVPRGGTYASPTQVDLELLDFLREHYRKEFEGAPVPYKFHIQEFLKKKRDLRGALRRLWGAGIIEKFATTIHTQSGRPQYISWYIWEGVPRSTSEPDVPQFFYDERVKT
jgi:hypothetical protein